MIALAASLAYIAWRIGWTLSGAALWLAIPLLLLEAHAMVSLALHTIDLWHMDAVAPPEPVRVTDLRVAVLIPTFNEPWEVLLPTLAAAVALDPDHETWVLDDGDRPWVAELAATLGVRYRARSSHEHAKAGNINAVLPELDVDLIAVLDADHVANVGFLRETLGYFADPDVALVQTPQDFYNMDSFEHIDRRDRPRYMEQELFYRGIQAGRNRWNAAFWCGTNAIIRLSALRSIGGLATETVTEDIHTTIRLHRHGWRTIYHNAVLARGLAAGDARQYLSQRVRWGTGAMQVLHVENPATVRGLTLSQRICYLSTLLGWFDSWRTLGYILLPLITVASGAMPIAAPISVFLPAFLGVLLLQRLALTALARGRAPAWQSMLFEFVRLPANLQATMVLFRSVPQVFRVTAKGRVADARTRMHPPTLLLTAAIAGAIALAWYGATLAGLTPSGYRHIWVAHGAAIWAVVNVLVLTAAVRRIHAIRFGAERRASVRFDLHGYVQIGTTPATLRDVSLTGLRASVPEVACTDLAVGQDIQVYLPAAQVGIAGIVRSIRRYEGPRGTDGRTVFVGIEFRPDTAAQAALALGLFRTGISPRLVGTTTLPLAG